ncbi:ABC transporter permease [Gryllotalpicola protaetiae]|uniref:ABC transporter permease n=1 Tax=Gryllotalpicola protaetiae TaxID=2419771 RepID=A0A387BE26_9MICO|nr:ABC transporter permease [Gryllotalpicola protaetiae]AYG02215.1 ABC transporter permease [Gryllotalpicola protaetiae]
MSSHTLYVAAAAAPLARRRPLGRGLPREAFVGGGIVFALLAVAVLAPLISPHSPTTGAIAQRLWNVGTAGHVLGTDGQGRDILSRLIWGARPALLGGLTPVLIAGVIGTVLGTAAGMSRSGPRALIMRVLDVVYAFPAILLAIAIGAALGPGLGNSIVSLSVVLIAPVARVAEGEVLRIRSLDFMDAARASGAGGWVIGVRQVLPNIAPALVVYCTSLVGVAIVYSAGMSFLGLGVVPPAADWGQMINDLRQYLYERPALALLPAAMIFIASIGFNLLGDGLKSALSAGRGEVAL